MIALKKICFLRPLFLHAATLMCFSEKAKREQLSVSAQKAAWATFIIKTISQSSLPASLRDPTLRDVIPNLPNPSKEFHFDEAEKNEVMKLFTQGIHLAEPFSAQVAYARQNVDSNKSSDKAIMKLIFFPNRNVTTQMFKQLMKIASKPYVNYLLTSSSGISKTVSIILFIHLSYHQTRFIYEASKDDKKKKEYNKLVKLQLIPKKAMKYWYWSVGINSDYRIKQLLLEQAVELEPDVREKLMEQPQLQVFIEKLSSHYKKSGLFLRPMVDQVNIIASKMRKVNQNRTLNVDITKYQVGKLDQLLKAVLLLGDNYTLTSSEQIEQRLLGEKKFGFLGMGLVNSQKQLDLIRIPYEETMLTSRGQLDFWQTFWFEIERCANLEPAKLQSAKQTFYKSIQSRNQSDTQKLKTPTVSVFYRFVYIREFLSKHNQRLLESIMLQDYQKIQELLKDFQQYCFKESKKIITKFLNNGVLDHRLQILFKLYCKARSLKENDKYRFRGLLLPTPLLDSILAVETQSEQLLEQKNTQKVEAKNNLRSLLAFQTDSAVRFIFTVQEFTSLAKQAIAQNNSSLAKLLNYLLQREKKWCAANLNTELGFAAEKFLVECFFAEGTLGFKSIQVMSGHKTKQYFQIYQSVVFQQLVTITQEIQDENNNKIRYQIKPTFQKNFQSAISKALQKPGEDILALPYTVGMLLFYINNGVRIGYASQDREIDFAILTYNKQLNMFEFESFDVTYQRNLGDRIQKIRTLFNEVFKGKLIQGRPFSLRHTILCPKDPHFQVPLAVPLTISYADLSKLSVNTTNFRSFSMFKNIALVDIMETDDKQYDAFYQRHDS